MDQVALKPVVTPVVETVSMGIEVKAIKTPNGKWTVIGRDFISDSYENVTEKDGYLLAYYTPLEFHIYSVSGPIYHTSHGELLECLNVKIIEKDVLEVNKPDQTSCIVIKEGVFDTLRIEPIKCGENSYGVVFLKKNGSLCLKRYDKDIETIIKQGCKECSIKYECREGNQNNANIAIGIAAEMENKEKQYYLVSYYAYFHRVYFKNYKQLQISGEVICFFPNGWEFILTQLDEAGRKELHDISFDWGCIQTEYPADGIELTSGYIIFWKNTSNGKVYTEMYNRAKGIRVLPEIKCMVNGETKIKSFEEMQYTGNNLDIGGGEVVILEKQINGETCSFLLSEGTEVLLAKRELILKSFIKEKNYIIIQEASGEHTIVWTTKNSIKTIEILSGKLKVLYCSLQTLVISIDGDEQVYEVELM